MSLVLAFDIERSGGRSDHDTIAIGCSVVDSEFNELDNLFLPMYFPKDTTFEQRCWDEFWSKHEDKLKIFEYKGDLNKCERERESIIAFQAFRAKWEAEAASREVSLELVSDNNVYDGGFINELIGQYLCGSGASPSTPYTLPIPYTASFPQNYKSFWETHSEQRGILAVVDPSFKGSCGFTKRISQLYEIPPMKKEHDHHPTNDAYTIAFDQQVVLGIRDQKIKLRTFNKNAIIGSYDVKK